MSPQNIWLWRPARLNYRSSKGLREIETSLWKGVQKTSHAPDQRPKQSFDRSPGQTYLLVLQGKREQRWLTWGHRDWWWIYQEYWSAWTLLEAGTLLGSLWPRPGPTQQPVGITTGTPQAKQLTGWGLILTHYWTGYLKASWACMPLTWPCPSQCPGQLHPPMGRHWPRPPGINL